MTDDKRQKIKTGASERLREKGLKWCPVCENIYERDNFYNNAYREDGKDHMCKDCRKKRQSQYRAERKERLRLDELRKRFA
jgi:predicted sulfurtransferase